VPVHAYKCSVPRQALLYSDSIQAAACLSALLVLRKEPGSLGMGVPSKGDLGSCFSHGEDVGESGD